MASPWNFYLDKLAFNRLTRLNSPYNFNQSLLKNFQYNTDKPQWISLATPKDFESAVRYNPIVKGAINLLASTSSSGKKIAVDINSGEIIPWTEKDAAIKQAYKLLVQRPNPLQSAKEFAFQGTFYLKTFGNRYVYANMPVGYDKKIDLLNINTLINLPSQFVNVKQTGKLYDQTTIEGIISDYAVNNTDPVRHFKPEEILHFNEVNISSEMASVMGISKLESLKMPITNTQMAFEAMNTILRNRGMQGILSPTKKDGMGANIPLTTPEKEEIDKKFKNDYGLLNGQNPFLLAPVGLDYIKTVMNSQELGIYPEFSNNAMLISNEFGIPPELLKTYIAGATYENQIQSVRRLYQDTTIPMVEDEDSYWSVRLGTFDYGFKIETSWNHIPALAENLKDNATALSMNARTGESAYNNNVITLNQYLELLGMSTIIGGDVYKYEWDKNKQAL